MPPETPPEIRKRILELFREQLRAGETPNATKVRQQLEKEGIQISLGPIQRHAKRNGISLVVGRRDGFSGPPGTGRPALGLNEHAARFSTNRKPALELLLKGYNMTATGRRLGITRQAVAQLVEPVLKAIEDNEPADQIAARFQVPRPLIDLLISVVTEKKT